MVAMYLHSRNVGYRIRRKYFQAAGEPPPALCSQDGLPGRNPWAHADAWASPPQELSYGTRSKLTVPSLLIETECLCFSGQILQHLNIYFICLMSVSGEVVHFDGIPYEVLKKEFLLLGLMSLISFVPRACEYHVLYFRACIILLSLYKPFKHDHYKKSWWGLWFWTDRNRVVTLYTLK